MKFETFFRLSSYATLAAALVALVVSGGVGWAAAAAMAAVLAGSWAADGTRWQLSERAGLLAVVASLPLFYLDWRLQTAAGWASDPARAGINALAHFILFLSAVKLWHKKKADRDWLFLYLISFFEVLLSAGLSLSPRFVATLVLYAFCAVAAVVAFEIRRARRRVRESETRLAFTPRARLLRRLRVARAEPRPWGEARRLSAAALCLLALVFALAMPIFYVTPRLGRGAAARAGGGPTQLIGFSDEVSLGEYGRLQQSSQVVMRVRVEDPHAARNLSLRWRGVALDRFDGRTWRRSTRALTPARKETNIFVLGTTEDAARLTTQTFFVEPVDTPVVFAAARAVGISDALPYVMQDREDGLVTRPHPRERITYRAFSDTVDPPLEALRRDNGPYTQEAKEHYLQVPDNLDPRIAELARGLITGTGADNRYDTAQVFEDYFRQNFKYSLEVRGEGADPLADFMFRVRAGHCEYYAAAMAMMLRSQNIAARVVNGFQMGEYNDAADVFTVRQSDAHSWVEVYFPETNAWVAFDPTPGAGRPYGENGRGPQGVLGKYAEALEMFWIQYVVDYDRQEQQQLATRLRERVGDLQRGGFRLFEGLISSASAWWRGAPAVGSAVTRPTLTAAAPYALFASAFGLVLFAVARRRGFRLRSAIKTLRGARPGRQSHVAFYERMTRALAARGLRRAADQTPLEFASTLDAPEALLVTRAYNRVRFGARELSPAETARVEDWLRKIEGP